MRTKELYSRLSKLNNALCSEVKILVEKKDKKIAKLEEQIERLEADISEDHNMRMFHQDRIY